MAFEEYICPELMILIPVLYIVGMGLKKSHDCADRYIPIMIGMIGVVIACIYEFSILGFGADSLYAGIVQGILCAGASVYFNQAIKQSQKKE